MEKALYWTMPASEYLKLCEQWKQDKNHKWCYNCKHFYYDYFCSYRSCNCYMHGSLDLDQRERHPAETAMTCKDYEYNNNNNNYNY